MVVESHTGKENPSPRYFYSIISLTALLATLVVIVILSSNAPSRQPNVISGPPAEMTGVAELRSALIADPDNPALNLQMGNELFDIGNYRESVVYYRRVLDIDSMHIPARIDLGVCYFNLNLTDSALIEMKKALEIDPGHVRGLFNIGVIYYNIGRNVEAQKYWEQLIRQHEASQEAQLARQMLEKIKT